MKRVVVLLIVALVLLPGAALAKGFYLAGAGGIGSAGDVEITTQDKLSLDDGSALALSGGYDLGWLRLDLELAHSSNDVDALKSSFGSLPAKGDITVTSLVFNACLEYEIASVVTPWIGLGVGTAVTDFHNIDSPAAGLRLDDSDSGGIVQVQLGAAIRFSEKWQGTIQYDLSSIPVTFTNVLAGQSHETYLHRDLLLLGARYEF